MEEIDYSDSAFDESMRPFYIHHRFVASRASLYCTWSAGDEGGNGTAGQLASSPFWQSSQDCGCQPQSPLLLPFVLYQRLPPLSHSPRGRTFRAPIISAFPRSSCSKPCHTHKPRAAVTQAHKNGGGVRRFPCIAFWNRHSGALNQF